LAAAMIALLSTLIDDRTTPQDLERIRNNLAVAIAELQRLSAAAMRIIPNRDLSDSVETPIPHGLGRPATVFVSPPRGAVASGRIEEVRTARTTARSTSS
jgi:hypothetical protein